MESDFQVGDIVKAFHPRTMGVVKHGEIKYVGKKWYSIDFGVLLGGRYTVDASHVLGLAGTPEDTEE